MSVFGVDLGNLYSKVSVARRRGIDIIINEVSKRETSTYVSFGNAEEGRMIGEKGADMKIRNFKNTVTHLKRLIGVKVASPQWEAEKKHCIFTTSEDPKGFVQVEVMVQGEPQTFAPEQLVAMMLGKLRSYADREASEESKNAARVRVVDCVLACPSYFNSFQRRLLYQATEVAGLNCLSLITEGTAVALNYFTRMSAELPETEDKGIVIVFADVGHSATQITTAKLWKSNVRVLSHDFDRNLGCREFDHLLADEFRSKIEAQYKMDVYEQKKAKVRLVSGCEKLRYTLSANAEATLNVECIMNDTDISVPYSRQEFEELSAPLWKRLEDLAKKVLEKVDMKTVTAVELIGGGSYMRKVKSTLAETLDKTINTTLNASEAVAKGCGFMGAILSPRYHSTFEFTVLDALVQPISISTDMNVKGKEVVFFPANDKHGIVETVTQQSVGNFDLYSFYPEPNDEIKQLSGSLLLGHWSFSDLPVAKNENGEELPGQPVAVDVTFKMNGGLLVVDSASVTETFEVEEPAVKKDSKKEGEEAGSPKRTKKTRKVDVKVTQNFINGLEGKAVEDYAMLERKMENEDVRIVETLDAKNSLEAYAYEYRSKADESLAKYMTADAREKFKAACDAAADWVYGEGEAATKEQYIEKLKELRAPGDAALARVRAREDMPGVIASAKATVQKQLDEANKLLMPNSETHIDKKKLTEITTKCAAAYEGLVADEKAIQEAPLDADLPITRAKVEGRAKEVVDFAKPIFATPKPQPPKEDKKDEKKDEKKEEGDSKKDAMDVDP